MRLRLRLRYRRELIDTPPRPARNFYGSQFFLYGLEELVVRSLILGCCHSFANTRLSSQRIPKRLLFKWEWRSHLAPCDTYRRYAYAKPAQSHIRVYEPSPAHLLHYPSGPPFYCRKRHHGNRQGDLQGILAGLLLYKKLLDLKLT